MDKQRSSSSELIFVLGLFGFYTLCALFLAITGANVYQKNVEATEFNYTFRTTVLYITEKIRQSENIDSVAIETLEQSDALVLSRDFDGTIYNTWIYVEDSYLKEVLLAEDMTVAYNIGQKIIPAQDMKLSMSENSLITIELTDNEGNVFSSSVYLETRETGVLQ